MFVLSKSGFTDTNTCLCCTCDALFLNVLKGIYLKLEIVQIASIARQGQCCKSSTRRANYTLFIGCVTDHVTQATPLLGINFSDLVSTDLINNCAKFEAGSF